LSEVETGITPESSLRLSSGNRS